MTGREDLVLALLQRGVGKLAQKIDSYSSGTQTAVGVDTTAVAAAGPVEPSNLVGSPGDSRQDSCELVFDMLESADKLWTKSVTLGLGLSWLVHRGRLGEITGLVTQNRASSYLFSIPRRLG